MTETDYTPVTDQCKQRANSYTDIATVKVADTTAVLKNKIKILGVTLDSHLTMDSQVSDICRSASIISVPCDIYGVPSPTM